MRHFHPPAKARGLQWGYFTSKPKYLFDKNSLAYFVDGKPVRTITGAQKKAAHHTTQLSAGKHTVTWIYKKKSNAKNIASSQVKINNIKLTKTDSSATNTPNTSASAETTTKTGGGGSSDILFFSVLLLLIGGIKRYFRK